MSKVTKGILYAVIVFLLLGTAGAVFGFLVPYYSAGTSMAEEGALVLQEQPDGTLTLSWPESSNADLYRVEILQPPAAGETEPKLLYRELTEDASGFTLPEIPEDQTLILRVTSGVKYKTILQDGFRFSTNALEAVTGFAVPEITITDSYADSNKKTFCVEVQTEGQWHWQLTDADGTVLQQQDASENSLTLQFGENGDFEMPEEGSDYRLLIQPVCLETGLTVLGCDTLELPISHASLNTWDLAPVLSAHSKNVITLTWAETRGMDYEVQLLEQGSWQTLTRIEPGEDRSYTSPMLNAEQTYEYRIVSIDPENGEIAAESEVLTYTVKPMTSCVTVWPVKDLTAYADSHWVTPVDTAKAGTAYYALRLENNMFAVRIGDEVRYIDSTYCMVNLPEYLGGLCSYNITNSIYSIYAVHEFGIPNVTGVVSTGYENIAQEDGSFLVPLLFPTAQKLYNAANAALEQGYRLKIYDSFRPYVTTREIYDLTELIIHDPLPETTYTGQPRSTITDLPENPRPGASDYDYGWVMTGYNYSLNAFLARTGSMHNLGIALDLTLEDAQTGQELAMQSSMHDLSQYSVLSKNNEAADLLGDIMHGAGFGGLVSEWWHFQDNHAKASLSLPYVQNGVNAECWVQDDFGWKYRTAKGSFLTGETATISGREYTFDENGYAVQ